MPVEERAGPICASTVTLRLPTVVSNNTSLGNLFPLFWT